MFALARYPASFCVDRAKLNVECTLIFVFDQLNQFCLQRLRFLVHAFFQVGELNVYLNFLGEGESIN
jgi:hypothetical protein